MWQATSALFWREVLRFYRQPQRIMGAIGAPILFWLILGSGFGRSIQFSGENQTLVDYRGFFLPGSMLLVVIFTSIFFSISVIQDRNEGFLQGVLASAAPRSAIVLGKVFAGVCLGWLQGVAMLCLLPLTEYAFSPIALLQASGVLFITALTLGGLGFVFAWRADSVQGFHSVMGIFLFPLWLVSGAFFPASSAAIWIQVVMMFNPLHYGLVALRSALYTAEKTAVLALSFQGAVLALVGFAGIIWCISLWTVRRGEY